MPRTVKSVSRQQGMVFVALNSQYAEEENTGQIRQRQLVVPSQLDADADGANMDITPKIKTSTRRRDIVRFIEMLLS